ncbi:hypothetical protein M8C13_18950, partial [Crossiella sp. SN42]|nr:hypothetical protein [Crossiella sp. SN42]
PGPAPGLTPTTPTTTPGPADPSPGGPAPVAPTPEASLEPGGGACAGAPEATTTAAAPESAPTGGGGGPAPAPAEPEPAAPDVSAQPPEAALASVGALPIDRMRPALSQVDSSVTRSVGEQQSALQAAPPSMERPAGAPRTLSGPPQVAPPAEAERAELERVRAAEADRQQQARAEQVRSEQQPVPRPHLAGDTQGKVTPGDVQNVQQAVRNVPTTDPAMNTTVAPPPKVELTGQADPARTDQQKAQLAEQSQQLHSTGRAESAKPLGEDQVFPDVPGETLAAEVPGPSGGPAPGPGGAPVDKGVAVVAQQERGPQVQAAVSQGQGQLGAERQNHEQSAARENARHESEVTRTVAENSEAQAAERGKVATDAAAKRQEWRAEQDQKIEENNEQASKEHTKANGEVVKKKTETDEANARKETEENQRIQRERQEAERKAEEEKRRKEKEAEGGGFFSWLASKVTSFFNDLLDAVTGFFNAAIQAINGIVRTFTDLVMKAIDVVRDVIVSVINVLADVLIALCDALAVFFPELAARIRKGIEDLRDAAIAAVNALAETLKAGVKALLDLLAKALTGLLRLLEAGLKAAVEAVRSAVNAAIEFAKAAIQMLGEFAAIIADIAADGVGTWLGKLGGSAKDGVQNHLWGAIQTGVREWFNGKVEEVLGLGKAVMDILIRGCLSMGKIAKMAWDGIIAALPVIIIQVVVERLVSLIIPAAGAVLAVVQGLMAAWGTISKILAAIGAFVAFLKAVRAGPAAALFAKAVAAGVVALLEFITNFLMTKLKGAAQGVGNTLKGIAARIGKGLGRAARGTRRAAGNAVNSARRGLRSASQALRPPRRPAAPVRRRPGAVAGTRGRPGAERRPAARRPAAPTRRPSMMDRAKGAVRTGLTRVRNAAKALGTRLRNSKLGKALANSARRIRDRFNRLRNRWRERQRLRQERRRQREEQRNSPQSKQRRLAQIIARIRPRIHRLLVKGVPRRVLLPVLAGMRLWYRLRKLTLGQGKRAQISAGLSPEQPVDIGLLHEKTELYQKIVEAARKNQKNAEQAAGGPADPKATEQAIAERDLKLKEAPLVAQSGQYGQLVKGLQKQDEGIAKSDRRPAQVRFGDSGLSAGIGSGSDPGGEVHHPEGPGKGRYLDEAFRLAEDDNVRDVFQHADRFASGAFDAAAKGDPVMKRAMFMAMLRDMVEAQREEAMHLFGPLERKHILAAPTKSKAKDRAVEVVTKGLMVPPQTKDARAAMLELVNSGRLRNMRQTGSGLYVPAGDEDYALTEPRKETKRQGKKTTVETWVPPRFNQQARIGLQKEKGSAKARGLPVPERDKFYETVEFPRRYLDRVVYWAHTFQNLWGDVLTTPEGGQEYVDELVRRAQAIVAADPELRNRVKGIWMP